MKRNIWLFVMIVVMMMLSACSKVPAGNVGVKVHLLGGSKGVDTEELSPGRYWIGFNEELYLFPTFTQNYVWTKNPNEGSNEDERLTFQTKEGLSVGADIGISYSVNPGKVSILFQKYRKGIDEITHIYLRNIVRDAFVTCASTKQVESIYGIGKADLIIEVQKMVKEQTDPIGINVEKLSYVGDLILPESITNAIQAKIKATQDAQAQENAVRQSEAEAKKKVAVAKGDADAILEVAKAQAEANRVLSASITPTLVNYKSIEKWDGKLPTMTGGSIPMINLNKTEASK